MKKKLLQLRREAIATIPPMDPSLVAIKEVSVLIDLLIWVYYSFRSPTVQCEYRPEQHQQN